MYIYSLITKIVDFWPPNFRFKRSLLSLLKSLFILILAQAGNSMIATPCPLNLAEKNTIKTPSLCPKKGVMKVNYVCRFLYVLIDY